MALGRHSLGTPPSVSYSVPFFFFPPTLYARVRSGFLFFFHLGSNTLFPCRSRPARTRGCEGSRLFRCAPSPRTYSASLFFFPYGKPAENPPLFPLSPWLRWIWGQFLFGTEASLLFFFLFPRFKSATFPLFPFARFRFDCSFWIAASLREFVSSPTTIPRHYAPSFLNRNRPLFPPRWKMAGAFFPAVRCGEFGFAAPSRHSASRFPLIQD